MLRRAGYGNCSSPGEFSNAVGGTYNGPIPGSQFTVTNGNVDIIGILNGAFFNFQDNYSGNCLDLIGNEGSGSISGIPTFTLLAGDTYAITFGVVAQALSTSLDFSVGLGSFSAREAAPYSAPAQISVSFTPTGTQTDATLTFTSITNVNNVNEPVLDNIVLTQTSPVTSANARTRQRQPGIGRSDRNRVWCFPSDYPKDRCVIVKTGFVMVLK